MAQSKGTSGSIKLRRPVYDESASQRAYRRSERRNLSYEQHGVLWFECDKSTTYAVMARHRETGQIKCTRTGECRWHKDEDFRFIPRRPYSWQ